MLEMKDAKKVGFLSRVSESGVDDNVWMDGRREEVEGIKKDDSYTDNVS